MDFLYALLTILFALIVGVGVGFFAYRVRAKQEHALMAEQHRRAEEDVKRMVEEAKTQQREIVLAAKDEGLRVRSDIENELKERRQEVQRQERRLQQKEETLDQKHEALDGRDRALSERDAALTNLRADIQALHVRQQAELERIAGLNAEQAREMVVNQIEEEARHYAGHKIRKVEEETRERAEEKARKILSVAVARMASDYVSETTVTTVPLPNDEMKGRIIGREGRNIRTFEQVTGVDLIVDDTPEAVTLACFDPVRREIARRALLKLISDGRIHQARIEETVNKCKVEVEAQLREDGERAAFDANVTGLHPEIIKLLGRLRYRTSYGQNQLHHAVETSRIATILAHEIGANVEICRAGGLLHDLGKAVDHEVEGPHALIGAELAKRYGMRPETVHTIAAHHSEEEPVTVEAWVVMAADAISGGRPGARREQVETYIKRLEALEGIANSFEVVERSFAIQAGRELRILVRPDQIDDVGTMRLARDIVKRIEEAVEYPGQIKVTIIRETRAVDYAK